MGILIAIAGWTLGSIVLGLLLGYVFGISAKRRRAEEQFILSLHTRSRGANHSRANTQESPKASVRSETG
jgi:hypothetical protein